jgi:hypothetical protein
MLEDTATEDLALVAGSEEVGGSITISMTMTITTD